ncbi:TIGR03751 family conjugal transfer lipoprotein [Alloalcanivorax xenomutans]|uniref:TIGR03751 family conjugal transfer lipoprotein n=1 Tax=Alloalcanivorax xenomutans TaxID=1094342 RepID=UPI003A80BD60
MIGTKRALVAAATVLGVLGLGGCATSQDKLMPVDEATTMADLWRQGGQSAGSAASSTQNTTQNTHPRLQEIRHTLRRPLPDDHQGLGPYHPYTRHVENEIRSQFPRLPNPDLVMYVFPHLAGSPEGEQVPVPGYSTVFPLYERVQYAQPGEVAWPWPALSVEKP